MHSEDMPILSFMTSFLTFNAQYRQVSNFDTCLTKTILENNPRQQQLYKNFTKVMYKKPTRHFSSQNGRNIWPTQTCYLYMSASVVNHILWPF